MSLQNSFREEPRRERFPGLPKELWVRMAKNRCLIASGASRVATLSAPSMESRRVGVGPRTVPLFSPQSAVYKSASRLVVSL